MTETDLSIAHDEGIPLPFLSDDFLEDMLALGDMYTVDLVVRRHECAGWGIAGNDLERSEIDLPQRALRHDGV